MMTNKCIPRVRNFCISLQKKTQENETQTKTL